jgi:hypothetical protein
MALNFLNNGYFAGKVGIGTESPAVSLEVTGSIRIDDGASFTSYQVYRDNIKYGDVGGGGNQFTIQASNNKNINLFDDNGTGLTVKDGGNIGIGTDSPLKKLSINGGDVAVNNGNSFIVGAAITGNTQIGELGADSGQLQLLTESTRDIKFGSTTYGNIMFLENRTF